MATLIVILALLVGYVIFGTLSAHLYQVGCEVQNYYVDKEQKEIIGFFWPVFLVYIVVYWILVKPLNWLWNKVI